MRHYSEITTQEGMDALLARVAGFHDSMAKELHLVNRGWVNPDRSMVMSHRFDARLLLHSQWDPVSIELLFIGVGSLSTNDPGEYWGASGHVERDAGSSDKCRISITFDDAFSIRAERLFYLDRPSWTGPQARFGEEVPHPDCAPATRIDDQWRQCSSCSEAFKAPTDAVYQRCSECGAVTELVDESAQQGDSRP